MPSFGLHQRLHGLRIGLAAGGLHDLADEPAGKRRLWLACSTLSGLAAMISSTAFSMAPVSVTCFMPRASTISAGVAAFGPDDLEQVLGDLAGDVAALIRSMIRQAGRR
jgi:hypothetical protein